MGILMERLKVTEDQAFDVLRAASQRNHIKLRDVAERLILTGELPTAA
jgi:AmiR/NasT family two-component response regulator